MPLISNYYFLVVVVMTTIVVIATMIVVAHVALAQKGLNVQAQKGYNKFIEDWKKVCPDSNNETDFCTGYLTGASIRSSGPG